MLANLFHQDLFILKDSYPKIIPAAFFSKNICFHFEIALEYNFIKTSVKENVRYAGQCHSQNISCKVYFEIMKQKTILHQLVKSILCIFVFSNVTDVIPITQEEGAEVFISPIRVVCKAWDALATMNLSIEKNMYVTTKILPIVKI